MATSSFERRIIITDPDAIEKLIKIINDETSKGRVSDHPYDAIERCRVEELLKKFLLRSNRDILEV